MLNILCKRQISTIWISDNEIHKKLSPSRAHEHTTRDLEKVSAIFEDEVGSLVSAAQKELRNMCPGGLDSMYGGIPTTDVVIHT